MKKIVLKNDFYKNLLILALPIFIQNLLVTSLNLVDNFMIGALGDAQVAAVGVCNQFFILYQLILNGIAGGCSIFIAQFWGKGNTDNIKKIIGVGIVSTFIIAVIMTSVALTIPDFIVKCFLKDKDVISYGVSYLTIVCISYLPTGLTFLFSNVLRSIQKPKAPMIISAVAIVTNVIGNYIFIFGKFGSPKLGVAGAALSTLIARLLECILILSYSFLANPTFKGKIKSYFEINWNFIKRTYSSIIPIVANELCWGIGFILYTAAYGIIGTTAVAASQISNTLQNLFMVVFFSIAGASMVFIGNLIGGGDKESAIIYSRKITKIAFVFGIIFGIIVYITAPYILELYTVSHSAKTLAIGILRVFAFFIAIRVVNVVLIIGIFRAGNDASFALKAEAFTMWLVGVPLAFIAAKFLHLNAVYVALIISTEEFIKFFVCIARLKSNKWLNDITNTFNH